MSLEHRYYQGQEPITIYTPLLTGYLAPVLTFLSFWESEGGMRWVSVEVDMGECVAGGVRSVDLAEIFMRNKREMFSSY